MALQALSFVHSATSRFLFLLCLCNNKPPHSLLFRNHNHSSKNQTKPNQNETKQTKPKTKTLLTCSVLLLVIPFFLSTPHQFNPFSSILTNPFLFVKLLSLLSHFLLSKSTLFTSELSFSSLSKP